uniref:Uncharacterized protein n=1 Tax=Anguilla anguilla TaxID=7936 RepID=A0A0E9TMU8_ANGAN
MITSSDILRPIFHQHLPLNLTSGKTHFCFVFTFVSS